MAKGTVKWFNKEKGFGFIMPDEGGKDVYFHASNLETPGDDVRDGQRVDYEVAMGRKGPEATHIKTA